MKIILEYTYTGSIKEENLTKDNVIEAFSAADYFQLSDLQNFIMKIIEKTSFVKNYSPELLSKIAEMMPLTEDNFLLKFLVENLTTIPLNTIEFGRLSITGLQYFLSYTHKKVKFFVTPEYEVFRYSAILAARQVSDGAFNTIKKRLPTLDQMENSIQIEIIDHQKVTKVLEPLIKFIDFNQIKGKILVDIIEPLEIIPAEIIVDAYRQKSSYYTDLNGTRGIYTNESNYIWDESACGSLLDIEENGKIAVARYDCRSALQSIRAKLTLGSKGNFEWSVILEKASLHSWIGICASEDFNYEIWAGKQHTGWVLGSNGSCWHSNIAMSNYCPKFGDGTKITIHLNMDKRTCAFTVNGIRYPEISTWGNLPSELCPVVSLRYPGRFRIESS
ncbi:hypothetical protein GLOIN_2v1836052 [Rhizophagus clarus]|nr:hypothetical protein GLOIN_2v1836052 [Rhizophagus clarus]